MPTIAFSICTFRRSEAALNLACPYQLDHSVCRQFQASLNKPTHRQRINLVFHLKHAGGQSGFVVVLVNRYGRLGDQRTVIEFARYEMDAAAVDLHTRGQRSLMRIETGEGW